MNLSGQTQVYGIVGDPVAHSLSPLFQNHFLRQARLDAVYIPFHVHPEALTSALSGLHAAHVQGLNITVPHKETALSQVQADDDARQFGAVNTLKRCDQGWEATNTDWQGFADVLQGMRADVKHAPVFLFGAGGTAKAVVHALVHQGARHIMVCNRSPERIQQLIRQSRGYPVEIQPVAWQQSAVDKACMACQTVINTTSIGLHADDGFPFALSGQGVALDAVYKPHGATAFTQAARAHYEHITDGLPMLIAQGMASFAFWHQNERVSQGLNLPDKLKSLQWVEEQLRRQPCELPGWRV